MCIYIKNILVAHWQQALWSIAVNNGIAFSWEIRSTHSRQRDHHQSSIQTPISIEWDAHVLVRWYPFCTMHEQCRPISVSTNFGISCFMFRSNVTPRCRVCNHRAQCAHKKCVTTSTWYMKKPKPKWKLASRNASARWPLQPSSSEELTYSIPAASVICFLSKPETGVFGVHFFKMLR